MAKNFFSSRMTAAEMRAALANEQASADAKLAKDGKLSAASRMAALFDEGTFVEIGAYVGRKTTDLDSASDDAFEPVVTGYGAINGTLAFAFSQDFARLSGALGEMHAKKIVKIIEMADRADAPIIGAFDSAGAKILEGVDALAGYGSIMAALYAFGKSAKEIKESLESVKYEAEAYIAVDTLKYLKKGGIMIFSTCTIDKEENEDVVNEFLLNHPDFSFLPFGKSKMNYKTFYPHIDHTDGFFICRLIRNGEI